VGLPVVKAVRSNHLLARSHWAVTALVLFVLVQRPAQAVCAQPPVIHFLKEHSLRLNKDAILPYSESDVFTIYKEMTQPGSLRFMGVRWLAPSGGALFVVDCQGRGLAALPLGGVTAFAPGIALPDGTTAIPVSYISGSGTGVLVEAVSFMVYSEFKLKILWSHRINENYSGEFEGYSRKSVWTQSADHLRIDVTIEATPEEGSPKESKAEVSAVTRESYCWNASDQRYEKCHSQIR
jgi:hypothetical protein